MKKTTCFFAATLVYLSVSAQCYSGDCENGTGTYHFENGDEYSGQFLNNKTTGIGYYRWAEGSQYYGEMLNGILHGLGLYAAAGAEKWTYGNWQNNELAEELSFAAGSCIVGDCEDGAGIYMDEEGNIYAGEYSNGTKTGYGRLNGMDASIYIGFFADGWFNGQGLLINPDGTREEGEFTGGYLKN
jgi:hypothetical protein